MAAACRQVNLRRCAEPWTPLLDFRWVPGSGVSNRLSLLILLPTADARLLWEPLTWFMFLYPGRPLTCRSDSDLWVYFPFSIFKSLAGRNASWDSSSSSCLQAHLPPPSLELWHGPLLVRRQLVGSTFPHSSGASLQNHAQPPQHPTSREERDFTGQLAVPAASTFLYLASIFPGESKQSDPFLCAVNFTEAKSLTVGVWRSHGAPKPHQWLEHFLIQGEAPTLSSHIFLEKTGYTPCAGPLAHPYIWFWTQTRGTMYRSRMTILPVCSYQYWKFCPHGWEKLLVQENSLQHWLLWWNTWKIMEREKVSSVCEHLRPPL